jgi:predicted outer membrane repeat protein
MKRILILLTSLSLIAGFAAVTPAPVKAAPSQSTYGGSWDLVVSQYGNDADYDNNGDCEYPDFNSIQDAVNYAEWQWQSPTTIYICNGIYYEQVDSTIGLTLVGENKLKTIIDGSNNSTSTVYVDNGYADRDITVWDITFRNGNSDYDDGYDGGALWTTDDVYCYNSVFTNNQAWNRGGAIYSESNDVWVQDCTFIGNEADSGGAVYADEYFWSTRSTFIDNEADSDGNVDWGDGGAVYAMDGLGDITDSYFEGNEAAYTGGAIYSNGDDDAYTSIIYRTTFKDNYADWWGGAIHFEDEYFVELKASNFIGNEAYEDGGAISLCAYSSDNYLTTFTAGRAQTLFQGNSAGDDGGAIMQSDCNSDADLNLTSARFLDNVANYGGAVLLYDGDLYVTGSVFTGNRAEYDGGAIYSEDFAEVRTSTFTRNVAVEDDGGAIYVCDDMDVTSSTFTGNSADDGGAIKLDCYDDLVVEGSTFTGNRAEGDEESDYDDGEGGAIFVDGGYDTHITRSVFKNNSATDEAGAISADGDTFSILNSTFMGNSAEEAGAVYSDETDYFELRGSLFQANRAFGTDTSPNFNWAVGAVMVSLDEDSFDIRGNRFISNVGWGVGALYLVEWCDSAPTFDQAAVRSNTWRSNRVTGGQPQTFRDVRTDSYCD